MRRRFECCRLLGCLLVLGPGSSEAALPQDGARAEVVPTEAPLGGSLGAEVGWSFDTERRRGVSFGAELVTALWVVGERLPVWATFGYRGVAAQQEGWISRPYTELGIWALASVGVGYGPEFVSGRDASHRGHLFVGVPAYGVSVFKQGPKDVGETFYLEPFYRYVFPAFGPQGAGDHHEAGLMVKWVTWGLGP